MKTFDINYFKNGKEFSHKYSETWGKVDYHCPSCGKKAVWEEQSGGDYYVGTQFLCVDCGASFYLPNGSETRPMDLQDQQRLAHLRDTSNVKGEAQT